MGASKERHYARMVAGRSSIEANASMTISKRHYEEIVSQMTILVENNCRLDAELKRTNGDLLRARRLINVVTASRSMERDQRRQLEEHMQFLRNELAQSARVLNREHFRASFLRRVIRLALSPEEWKKWRRLAES